ncbi:MAG: hypothetical protein KAH57_09285, partial [Thermoplasmata archaeon]|nr:hypothetical protein [Thermoplasmata archaeon]
MIFVAIAFMIITLYPAGSSSTETTPTRTVPVLDGVISTGEYEYLEKLEDEEFEVSWTVNGSRIHMALWVKSTGWVSLGLDPADRFMTNADMIFGWVSGGTAYMKDAFSTGKYGPHPEDTTLGGSYDIISFEGAEAAGYTTIEFVREMTTGDPYDKSFVNGTAITIIWAYGDTDTWTDMHVSDGRGNLTLGGTPPPPP